MAVLSSPVLYVSELLNRPVFGRGGERIGSLRDLIVRPGGEPFPPVAGLIVRVSARNSVFLPASHIAEIALDRIELNSSRLDLRRFQRREGEMLLQKDVMDKQIVNIGGLKVVRVNDLQIQKVGGAWRLAGADVSMSALLSRLGWRQRRRVLSSGGKLPEIIPWENLEFFASDVPVPLQLRHEGIRRLHPTDIAKLLEDLSPAQSSELVASMPDELAADTMEEIDEDMRQDILEQMDDERAADILEEMEDDAAADVIQEMDDERAADILEEMEDEEADAVKRLLAYEENTAGGLMTTELFKMSPNATVGEAVERLREEEDLPAHLYYICVTDPVESGNLAGVVGLKDLLLRPPATPLSEIMETRLITSRVDDSALEAALKISEYNMTILPVLDEKDQLIGVVSVDDAIDMMFERFAPAKQRERLFR